MKYYSTNKQAPLASLEEAVVKGLAGDKGLYMPEHIRPLDKDTISGLKNKSFHEIACTAAQAFFGEDIEPRNARCNRPGHAVVRDAGRPCTRQYLQPRTIPRPDFGFQGRRGTFHGPPVRLFH